MLFRDGYACVLLRKQLWFARPYHGWWGNRAHLEDAIEFVLGRCVITFFPMVYSRDKLGSERRETRNMSALCESRCRNRDLRSTFAHSYRAGVVDTWRRFLSFRVRLFVQQGHQPSLCRNAVYFKEVSELLFRPCSILSPDLPCVWPSKCLWRKLQHSESTTAFYRVLHLWKVAARLTDCLSSTYTCWSISSCCFQLPLAES